MVCLAQSAELEFGDVLKRADGDVFDPLSARWLETISTSDEGGRSAHDIVAAGDDPFDDFDDDDFDDEFDDDFEEDWEDDLTEDVEFPDTFGGEDEDEEFKEEDPDSPFSDDPEFDED